ncbi:MAG: hypothetical protein MUF71_10390 [Candidatus Kapabacteria bacterium]|jgi:hypothetical protein|nr:hypothetical protein [Candidatus Kapabacteria bacterium]
MKILLDENVPRKLRLDFGEAHEVVTMQAMKWLGKKNGELLGLMTLNGFDAFITLDRNLQFQQNLYRFPITIFVLVHFDNRYQALQNLIPQILRHLEQGVLPSTVIEVRQQHP